MELYHHGILKQKWGVRNGPPYPLRGGDYTPAQRKASRKRKEGVLVPLFIEVHHHVGELHVELQQPVVRYKDIDRECGNTHDKCRGHTRYRQ